MAAWMLVIALVAFLSGAAAAVFFMLVAGIRKGDRPERILNPGSSRLNATTRSVLGSRAWPDVPVYRDDHEDGSFR